MADAMVTMFPKGIRTLIVDDDAKFLKMANMLLSILNFEAVICSSVTRALKSLTSDEHAGFDAILVHAAKVAAYGFNFHAIIETDLHIPVIYFLPLDYHTTGDEADELLHTLQAGTYIVKRPLDAYKLRTLLWTVIARRKRDLEAAAKSKHAAANAFNFKGVRGERGQKRKCSSSPATMAGCHLSVKGKENNNVASQQQPTPRNHGQGKTTQKNISGEVFNVPQPSEAMMNTPQFGQHRYNSKFFTNATMPPYNPDFFSDTTGLSSNAGIFGNNMPLAVVPTMVTTPAAYEPQFPQGIGNQQQPVGDALDTGAILESLFSDDFNDYSTGSPLVAPDQILGLALNVDVGSLLLAHDQVLGLALDVDELASTIGGASGITNATPFMAPHYLGAMPKVGATNVALFMAPHQDLGSMPNGGDSSSSNNNNNDALFMTSNVSDLTMAGGAFGNNSSGPFMAPQDLGTTLSNGGGSNAAPVMAPYQDLGVEANGDQLALDNNIYGSFIGSQGQGSNTMMNEDDFGLTAAMQYEGNTSLPLDALRSDLHGPIFEFDDINLDVVLGGSIGGGVAAADGVVGTSPAADEEEDGGVNVLDNLVGLEIPHDVFQLKGYVFP
ncbi:unnamed protein product [Urochloa decumbens]|uniref:Response regulatory domain-containing protein n=1 Tax=Urochloa decumbens TaxID=240449 RepID=A0ABC9G9T3_9POAL